LLNWLKPCLPTRQTPKAKKAAANDKQLKMWLFAQIPRTGLPIGRGFAMCASRVSWQSQAASRLLNGKQPCLPPGRPNFFTPVYDVNIVFQGIKEHSFLEGGLVTDFRIA
jgi:hypothetical protein